jgi:hypothetical protein
MVYAWLLRDRSSQSLARVKISAVLAIAKKLYLSLTYTIRSEKLADCLFSKPLLYAPLLLAAISGNFLCESSDLENNSEYPGSPTFLRRDGLLGDREYGKCLTRQP